MSGRGVRSGGVSPPLCRSSGPCCGGASGRGGRSGGVRPSLRRSSGPCCVCRGPGRPCVLWGEKRPERETVSTTAPCWITLHSTHQLHYYIPHMHMQQNPSPFCSLCLLISVCGQSKEFSTLAQTHISLFLSHKYTLSHSHTHTFFQKVSSLFTSMYNTSYSHIV